MTIDLNNMQKQLEAKRAELQASIANLTPIVNPTPVSPIEANDGSQEPEEATIDFVEMETEQAILTNQQTLLTEVQQALQRIKQGTYGKCANCGRPIPEKRLEALPWATRDVKCEEELEKQNLSSEDTLNEEV